MTCFELALFSLGASGAALVSVFYVIWARPASFGAKGPGETVKKPPAYAPAESIGLRLKRKIDRE